MELNDDRPEHDFTNETANPAAAALVARSNRLGADPKNTNYAGGNTSAKGTETDPVTGEPVELLWVKGSGGDLGTLTESGLAVLRLDRMRALVDVYPGVEREDEMVAAFDYCLHGKGGAAPSIDTAMHGLVDAAHVDHLHPDSGIAIATAADGEALTTKVFGDKVVWVPWRRPGFQLGLDIAEIKEENPQAVGCILGGHGITAWGDTSEESEANSLWIIDTAAAYIAEHGKAEPFGPPLEGYAALPDAERRARAAALAGTIRGIASQDRPMVGHFTDSDGRAGVPGRRRAPAARRARHQLPGPLPAHQGQAARARPAGDRLRRGLRRPAEGARGVVPRGLPGLLRPQRDAGQPGDPRRGPADRAGARRRDVLLRQGQADRPRGRRVLRQRDQRDARRRGALDVRPDRRGREVPHRVLGAGGGQAPADAEAQAAGDPDRARHRRRRRHRQGDRHPARGRGRLRRDRRPGRWRRPQAAAAEIGGPDVAVGVAADVSDEAAVQAMVDATVLAFGGVDLVVNNAGLSLSKSLLDTTAADWDLQHNVMAKGSFLVSKAAARVLIDQGMGGDIVYISSKNSVFAGPNNIAYSATKADQAHQVRLLAAELGEHGIKVNGVNPDGVVQGSGIFAERLGRQPRRGLRRGGEGPRASSTPSARSSSARCCPSTSPTPCSCCAVPT